MSTARESQQPMAWDRLAALFRVLRATDLMVMDRLARYQEIRDTVPWLTPASQPLIVLFVSHRWETLSHPDPGGRQLRALKQLLGRTVLCLEALLAPRAYRLRLVTSLFSEGSLQGYDIARRMLGFGVFGGSPSLTTGDPRTTITNAFRQLGKEPGAFRTWALDRIGVWIDYCCMPQRPLEGSEVEEFRESLRSLDALVASSNVLALRAADDDYSARGWCAAEFFLGSRRSFSRSLFVDIGRIESGSDLAIPPAPSSAAGDAAAAIMDEAYLLDLAAFRESIDVWVRTEQSLVDTWPPDAWSDYRTLQGSGFFDRESDPNPFRRVLEAVREIETFLIGQWLMQDGTHVMDLGAEVWLRIARAGLECSDHQDLLYLGLLLPCHGWVECFRPLFRSALDQFLEPAPDRAADASAPRIRVRLKPLDAAVRNLFFAVAPSTPASWTSRLGQHSGVSTLERPVIERLLAGLQAHPPGYEILDPA